MFNRVKFEKIASKRQVVTNTRINFWTEFLDYLVYFIKVFVVVLLVYIFIKDNVFRSFQVNGASMSPNYATGDIVYIDKITPRFGELKRGDVIVIKQPDAKCPQIQVKDSCFYIKRVVAIPGEQVIIQDGSVFVITEDGGNPIKLDETAYLPEGVPTYKNIRSDDSKYVSKVLAKQEYFALGDNRLNSIDSRSFGPVTNDEIQGKEFYRAGYGFFDSPIFNIRN